MSVEAINAKKIVVEEIAGKFKESQSAVLVEYRGLSVADVTELRRALREEDVEFKVYKNKLVQRATESVGYADLNDKLVGPNALAFGKSDAVAPARILANFAKTADALELKCGVVEGTYYDAAGIATIATIPSREELISKFLGSIQSPITNFARVIKQIAEKNGEVA